jgi:hypothetical protein
MVWIRIAEGTAGQADAQRLFDELEQSTRSEVAAYLASYGGRRGLLSQQLLGYPAWQPGQPRGAVIHVPALHGRAALDTVDNVRRFMTPPPPAPAGKKPSPKSTNIEIGWPDGRLLCPVHPRHPAWHAGGANRSRLGIDLVSPGPLVPTGGTWITTDGRAQAVGAWRRWDGKGSPIVRPDGSPLLLEEDVLDLGEVCSAWGYRFWHCPTPAQILGLAVALRALRLLYPTIQPELVERHADLAPGSRVDPGPGIPLEQLRAWAWGTADLRQLVAEASASGWQDWLRQQWLSPTGLVTERDRCCPGRPAQAGEVG